MDNVPVNSSKQWCIYASVNLPLLQTRVCCLFSTKLLDKPTLTHYQMGPGEQTSVKSEFEHFYSQKCIWKCLLKSGSHLVPPSSESCLQWYLDNARWFNSVWSSDGTWRQWSWSKTLTSNGLVLSGNKLDQYWGRFCGIHLREFTHEDQKIPIS